MEKKENATGQTRLYPRTVKKIREIRKETGQSIPEIIDYAINNILIK